MVYFNLSISWLYIKNNIFLNKKIGVYYEHCRTTKKNKKAKKISVYKLSKISGISENHIHNIEKGINDPNIRTLNKILKSMEITLAEFFNNNSNVYYPNDFEKELLQSISLLTKKQANILLALIKNMNWNFYFLCNIK